jgi:hypothetical protein
MKTSFLNLVPKLRLGTSYGRSSASQPLDWQDKTMKSVHMTLKKGASPLMGMAFPTRSLKTSFTIKKKTENFFISDRRDMV